MKKVGGMDFVIQCAQMLDRGEDARTVLSLMRARYSTPGCLRVKTCQVRKLCKAPAPLEAATSEATTSEAATSEATSERRLPENVRELHVSGDEARACKRAARLARLGKNQQRRVVRGAALLDAARRALSDAPAVAELALALMLVTGRRTCEVLSGASSFEPVAGAPYAAAFSGQAKRRARAGESDAFTYIIPLLAEYEAVATAYARLRALQRGAVLSRAQASRKYQSLLSRRLAAPFSDAGSPHGLRGVYACMALRAFRWGGRSDSYVTMCILGHRDLEESLVYTTFDVGDDFAAERLGEGRLTERCLTWASPTPPPS